MDMSPRTEEKDRPIDPMSGKKFARKRARTGFEPLDKRTGASPSCLRVSHNPCLLMLPFRFAHAMRMRPLSVGRVESAFHSATANHAVILNYCKEIGVVSSDMVNRKRAVGGAYRAGGEELPLNVMAWRPVRRPVR
jgi:hypothetical protein